MTLVPWPEQMDQMGRQGEEQLGDSKSLVLHTLRLSCLSNTQTELLRRQPERGVCCLAKRSGLEMNI